jgi:hypothetical protein
VGAAPTKKARPARAAPGPVSLGQQDGDGGPGQRRGAAQQLSLSWPQRRLSEVNAQHAARITQLPDPHLRP